MSKRGFWNSVALLLLGFIVVVLVVGILSFLNKSVDTFPKKDSAVTYNTDYNIAYGYTAPTDTTKLWVKCPEPKKIEISDTINKTITNEKIEILDWELDIDNESYAGAVVGTDLFVFTREKGIIKIDLLTGENSQVSTNNSHYEDTAVVAIPYGQYIYVVYSRRLRVLPTSFVDVDLWVKKFNTVNNTLAGSWDYDDTIPRNPSFCLHGFIYNDLLYIETNFPYNYIFDLNTCKFTKVSASNSAFRGIPHTKVQYEIFNNICYSFLPDGITKIDLNNNFEKELVPISIYEYYAFTSKGIGTNLYLFGPADNLNSKAIKRFNLVNNSLYTLDILMTAKREFPIVVQLGANFYILGGDTSGTDYNICEKFTVDFELESGTLILLTNGKKANEIVLRTDEQGVDYKTSISCAYIGNSQGKGESVEVYLYDNDLSDWRLIAA